MEPRNEFGRDRVDADKQVGANLGNLVFGRAKICDEGCDGAWIGRIGRSGPQVG
jgi:hypothetical protein